MRATRAFRPRLECAEERVLATVLPMAPHLGGRLATFRAANLARDRIPVRGADGPRVVMSAGPTQGALPNKFQNWGVISIWNTTNQRLTFSVSASTYMNGRFFNFTLRPGQYQSYYASFDQFNNAPLFRVSFDPINKTNPVAVTDVNVVFERMRWYPRVGTEGRPYAIAVDVSGYYLTPI